MRQRPGRSDYRRAVAEIEAARQMRAYPAGIVRYSLEDEYDDNPLAAMGRVWEKNRRAQCERAGIDPYPRRRFAR
jgi:hypothetical protein